MKTKTPKAKTPLPASAFVAELRAIAADLASTSQFDMLDHSRILADTAKNIRAWLRKVELAPARVIVEIEGGNVSAIYCSDAKAHASVLDRDLAKVGEGDPKREAVLIEEAQSLTNVA